MRRHIPVLPEEILDFARSAAAGKEAPLIVDGTLGDGGHTLAFREHLPDARILANDRDEEMLARAAERIREAGVQARRVEAPPVESDGSICLRRGRFGDLADFLGDARADFILLDLGISLHHFLGAGRGFSYTDEALDMRLDKEAPETAADLLNRLGMDEMAELFREYGEEPYAGRIARAIVDARPVEKGSQLADIVMKASPGKRGGKNGPRIHPATKVFQALRIRVNGELEQLEQALADLPGKLAPGGSLAIISFHSLEDRLVKRRFRDLADKVDPEKLASLPEYKRRKYEERRRADPGAGFSLLTRRPIRPGAEEIASNPAARSSLLRVLSKRADK